MKKLLQSLFLLLFVAVQAMAQVNQDRTVTGTVTGADDGLPLPGVSVRVTGTQIGTQTNGNGSYSINVPTKSKTLTFSFLGFKNTIASIPSSGILSIKLQEDAQLLTEVVVTALGVERDKRSLNYSTQTIKADAVGDRGEPNVLNALQGKVSGVQIVGASGSPGSSTNINIRGITSFTGSNQPLFIVDGVPISNAVDRTNGGPLGTLGDSQPSNRALDINPDNIESINVLKGAAASVLYGSRASSGVIVITTKKGTTNNKSEIIFSSNYNFQNVYGLPKLQNTYGQGSLGVFNPVSANSWGPSFDNTPTVLNNLVNGAGVTTPYKLFKNNIKDFYNTGKVFSNNLNIAGGDQNKNFSLAIANTTQDGIIPNTDLTRTNVQVNANTVLVNKLKVGGSVGFTQTVSKGVLGGNGSTALGQLVNIPRSYDLQGTPYKDDNGNNLFFLPGSDNPYFGANENPLTSEVNRVLGNANAAYDILPWLNASFKIGLDTYTDRRKQIFAVSSAFVPAGQVLQDQFFRSEINTDLIVTARRKGIFLDKLNGSLLIGQNLNQRKFQNTTLQGDNLTIPGFYNTSNATVFTNGSGESSSLRRILGYYSQLSVDYDNYVFLELSGRVDQSSTLPKDKNTYFYPAASLGFVFTDALKLQSDILSYGKLRASIARVGKDADPYLLNNVYVSSGFGNNVASFNFPFNGISGFTPSSRIAPKSLSPEFTDSYEFGGSLGFLRNRLNLDVTYFNSKSKNQILDVAVPTSTGFDTRTTNIGQLNNNGIEVLLSGSPISKKGFKWEVSLNATRIRSKVVSIAPGVTSFPIPGSRFGGSEPSIVLNKPYGVILGNRLPRSPDGQFLINSATGTFAPALAGEVIADPNPDLIAGLSNAFSYKGVRLSFLFDTQQGGDIVSFTSGFLRSRGALEETGVDRELPRVIPGVIDNGDGTFRPNNIQIPAQTYWGSFGLQTDLNVYDATVYRFREFSVGYTLPAKLLTKSPFGSVSLSLVGRNLFYYAPNSPLDPEVNTQGAGNQRGLELQSAPNVRSFGFNVKFSL
jgi:TonB-linked SusC/RagA family outer membrane protein